MDVHHQRCGSALAGLSRTRAGLDLGLGRTSMILVKLVLWSSTN